MDPRDLIAAVLVVLGFAILGELAWDPSVVLGWLGR